MTTQKIREQCGSVSGFQMHLYLGEDTCKLCREAKVKYNKRNKTLRDLGRPTSTLIPVQGTVRRLQGLMWMGWPVNYILDKAGVRRRSIVRFEATDRIHKEEADKIAAVYKRLAMKWAEPKYGLRMNEITRAKKYARERQYVSPLGWEDIENEEFNWSKHIWGLMTVEEKEEHRRRNGRLTVVGSPGSEQQSQSARDSEQRSDLPRADSQVHLSSDMASQLVS